MSQVSKGAQAWILNALIESDPSTVVAVPYREKILLVTFSFPIVSSERQRILNASLSIQMLMSNYRISSQPPHLPLLGRSYTSFDPQIYVDQWHPDVRVTGYPGCCKESPAVLNFNLEKKNTVQQTTWERLLTTVICNMLLLVFSDIKLISSPFPTCICWLT